MLEQMLAAGSCAICLLYPPGMEEEVTGIRAGLSRPERLLLSPDAPSLAGLFAQLRQCQGLISVDTATVHIAAGLHKPILGLYNPDIGAATRTSWSGTPTPRQPPCCSRPIPGSRISTPSTWPSSSVPSGRGCLPTRQRCQPFNHQLGRDGAQQGFVDEVLFRVLRQLEIGSLGIEHIDGLITGWLTGLAMILSPPGATMVSRGRSMACAMWRGRCHCRQTAGSGRIAPPIPVPSGS